MFILDGLALLGVSTSLFGAFTCFRREKRFTKMKKHVSEMDIFDFEKVINVSQLPTNKTIALRATVDSSSLKNARIDKTQDVVLSLFAVSQNPTQMFGILQGLTLNIINQSKITLPVAKSHGKSAIFYDLHKISDDFKHNEHERQAPLGIFQRIQNVKGDLNFAEYAILPNEKYIFVGRIQPGNTKSVVFTPRIIMGDNKIGFLKNLDYVLGKNNKTKKYCLVSAAGIIVGHQVFKRVFPDRLRTQGQFTQV